MNVDEIKTTLTNYRKINAEIQLKNLNIDQLKLSLQYIPDTDPNTEHTEAIEELSLKAKSISDMPSSNKAEYDTLGEVCYTDFSVVEIASMGHGKLVSQNITKDKINKMINDLEKTVNLLQYKINQIDASLQGLSARQMFILDARYRQGLRLEEVSKRCDGLTIVAIMKCIKNAIKNMEG